MEKEKQKLASFWEKTKEYSKKGAQKAKEGYEKSKKAVKDKIHEEKRKLALSVLKETKGKVTTNQEKIVLKGAQQIVSKKFDTGGVIPEELFEKDYLKFKKHIKDGYGKIDSGYIEETWENLSDLTYSMIEDKLVKRLKKDGLYNYGKGGKMSTGGEVSDTKYQKLKSLIENRKYNEAVDYYLNNANITSNFVGSDVWNKLKKENNFKEFEKIYNNDDRVGMHHDSYGTGGGINNLIEEYSFFEKSQQPKITNKAIDYIPQGLFLVEKDFRISPKGSHWGIYFEKNSIIESDGYGYIAKFDTDDKVFIQKMPPTGDKELKLTNYGNNPHQIEMYNEFASSVKPISGEEFLNIIKQNKHAKGGGVNDSGLMVIGKTTLDNNSIGDVVEEEGYYAEWNPREGYWFFPEEVDMYDDLEMELDKHFVKRGINARFEGVFGKGGSIKSFKAGDKVKTREGKIETIIRKNKNGNYETKECDYTWNPANLTLVSRANKPYLGEQKVMKAKLGAKMATGGKVEEAAIYDKLNKYYENYSKYPYGFYVSKIKEQPVLEVSYEGKRGRTADAEKKAMNKTLPVAPEGFEYATKIAQTRALEPFKVFSDRPYTDSEYYGSVFYPLKMNKMATGGTVIGKTNSGKSVYSGSKASIEKNYTAQDHKDAAYINLDKATELTKKGLRESAEFYNSEFDRHIKTSKHKGASEMAKGGEVDSFYSDFIKSSDQKALEMLKSKYGDEIMGEDFSGIYNQGTIRQKAHEKFISLLNKGLLEWVDKDEYIFKAKTKMATGGSCSYEEGGNIKGWSYEIGGL